MRRIRWQRVRIRRGAAMALALVVLLVVGVVSGLTLQAMLRSHRQVREEEQRVQAELLADSALSRAVVMLRKDPAWGGETWKVDLADSADSATRGVAEIRVLQGVDAGSLQISVAVVYPDEPVHRAQSSREMTFFMSKPGDGK